MGWVDRHNALRDDVLIDTTGLDSHVEMLAANQRAFEVMMEGFEQMESIIHGHDQLIAERLENAQIVQNAQDALIRDRKGHFQNFCMQLKH